MITDEEIDELQYGDIGRIYADALARSMAVTRERVAADILGKALG